MGGRDPGHGDNVDGSQSRRLARVPARLPGRVERAFCQLPDAGGAVRRDPLCAEGRIVAFGLIMIEDPPPLVFGPPVERPPAETVERFRGVPTSFIVDALGGAGALDWRIKPLVGRSLVGVALTCDCGPVDNLAFMAALAECLPGDVLVVATGGYTGAAVTGDLLIGVAKNRGAAGFVTDGLVRDLDDLETVGLPIYAAGVTPNSPQRRGPGSVGLAVVCGGVSIASGDVVVGDRDGVVVVPRARISATLEALEHVKEAEAATLKRVRAGLKELFVDVPALSGRGKP
jgi:4-hydroxy-4-methyl-2-oxoglutarate aldolase